MKKPIIRIHNTETNEIIDREMNDAEFVEYKKDQAEIAKAKAIVDAELEAKAQAKAAAEGKLTALGLTADEAKLLLG